MRIDISGESSARQRIHMKHQALFSPKDKNKNMSSAAISIGVLRVNIPSNQPLFDSESFLFSSVLSVFVHTEFFSQTEK